MPILHDDTNRLVHSERIPLQRTTVDGAIQPQPQSVIKERHWQHLDFVIHALHAFDPAIPDDEVRATLGLESLITPPTAGGSDEPLPITRDADLEMLVHLYRTLPERQRRTLVAVVRATASSPGEAAPPPAEISHTGS